MTTLPKAVPHLTHSGVTGPVSERWLQQTLLPRLFRRPYGTHLYFQQRMTADGAIQDVATVPRPALQPNSCQTSQPESPFFGCQEFCTNSNGRVFAEVHDTALHGYQERLIDSASKSLDRSPHHDTTVAPRATYMPLALSEPLSPGSTIQNTEEEYEVAIEICLSSHRFPCVKRRNDTPPYDRSHERSDGRPSKRICTIGEACKHSEELGAVEATAVEFENQDKYNSVRPRGGTSTELDLSVLQNEDNPFSHIEIPPDTLAKPASATACPKGSQARDIFPRFRPLNSTSESVCSVAQTLTSSSILSPPVWKDVDEGNMRPMTSNQDVENKPDPQCAGVRLVQVIKCKGAFLDPYQIWCPVPGGWEDAVAFSEDTRRRITQQQAY